MFDIATSCMNYILETNQLI